MRQPRGDSDGRALHDQVAMVTGGAGGLGSELCRRLARAGARVVCADIDGDRARALAERFAREDLRIWPLAVDVSRPAQTTAALERVVREHGRIDILINNAAVDVTAPADELSIEDWTRIVDTNLNGPYWLSRAAFPRMKRQGGGQIVNIASTASKRAWTNAAAYHASKWGLLGLSHALHVEGRAHRIKVAAVVCGGMRTPFLLERFPDIDTSKLQDARHVAETVYFVLTRPPETAIPEIMVIPMSETSWP